MALGQLEDRLKDKKIVIYGAGIWASVFYTYLRLLELDSNIVCFVVTTMQRLNTSLHDKSIRQYDEIKNELADCFVVIAIKNAEDLMDSLSCDHNGGLYCLTESQMEEIRGFIFSYYANMPIQRNKILVDCFGGRNGYSCNPKYIIEKLLEKRYPVEVVWNVLDRKKWEFPDGVRAIVYNSPEYFQELYTAGIVIDNSGVSSFPYKRPEQYAIHTWHGTGPFKKVGVAEYKGDKENIALMKKRHSFVDVFISNSKDNTEMFRESFCYDGEIYECGSPRCDILFQENHIKEKVYETFGIAPNKKILLYAPTFRGEWNRSENISTFKWYDLNMKQVLDALSQRFGEEFILMYRFHHALYEHNQSPDFYPDGIDVTFYPDIMELIVAADVMITDYSSAMWDFSLQRRPVFLYHNDEREYADDRGFYWPISRWPYPNARTCEELCETIREFDEGKYLERLEQFFQDDPSYDDGHAADRVAERIIDVIEHPEKYGKEYGL
ncbi:MAG: CDP-glycerol glycerophosphotransferase family protein [Lachnospiraceae bacterium]|nr:CDP-glycerol glycerophosphotransferase family protein [Lachnospiraceae bacterium]